MRIWRQQKHLKILLRHRNILPYTAVVQIHWLMPRRVVNKHCAYSSLKPTMHLYVIYYYSLKQGRIGIVIWRGVKDLGFWVLSSCKPLSNLLFCWWFHVYDIFTNENVNLGLDRLQIEIYIPMLTTITQRTLMRLFSCRLIGQLWVPYSNILKRSRLLLIQHC